MLNVVLLNVVAPGLTEKSIIGWGGGYLMTIRELMFLKKKFAKINNYILDCKLGLMLKFVIIGLV
jgi:hypothetical protein